MKYVEGKIYHILCLDHCSGEHGKTIMELLGLLVSQDKDYIYLATWWINTKDKKVFDDNMEQASVLKSTILKKRTIKPLYHQSLLCPD